MAEPGMKPMSDCTAHFSFRHDTLSLTFLSLSVACNINHLLQPLIIILGFHALHDYYSNIHLDPTQKGWEPEL